MPCTFPLQLAETILRDPGRLNVSSPVLHLYEAVFVILYRGFFCQFLRMQITVAPRSFPQERKPTQEQLIANPQAALARRWPGRDVNGVKGEQSFQCPPGSAGG